MPVKIWMFTSNDAAASTSVKSIEARGRCEAVVWRRILKGNFSNPRHKILMGRNFSSGQATKAIAGQRKLGRPVYNRQRVLESRNCERPWMGTWNHLCSSMVSGLTFSLPSAPASLVTAADEVKRSEKAPAAAGQEPRDQ